VLRVRVRVRVRMRMRMRMKMRRELRNLNRGTAGTANLGTLEPPEPF
jgi:hypothetical protein